MAFTVAFHPGAPLLLGGRRPVGAAAAATWHLPGPRASRRGQAPAHHRPAVRMATAPGGGGGDGDGASGDDVDATGARKPRGDPEWLDMAKQVGGRDGDGGGRKRGRSFWPFGGGKAAAKAEADDEEESRPAQGYGAVEHWRRARHPVVPGGRASLLPRPRRARRRPRRRYQHPAVPLRAVALPPLLRSTSRLTAAVRYVRRWTGTPTRRPAPTPSPRT